MSEEKMIGEGNERCSVCGKSLWDPATCRLCGRVFCSKHAGPSRHNCAQLEGSKRSPRLYLLPLGLVLSIVAAGIILLPGSGRDEPIWQRTYGPNRSGMVLRIIAEEEGYVVAGNLAPDASLMMIGEDGDEIWAKTYGDWQLEDLSASPDEGYLLLGSSDIEHGYNQPILVKTDQQGDVTWKKFYGYQGYGRPRAIVPDGGGGYIIAGDMPTLGDDRDIHIWRVDGDGNLTWDHTYPTLGQDMVHAIVRCADGGFVMAGQSAQAGKSTDACLVKIDDQGTKIWERSYGTAGNEAVYSIITTEEGFIAAGDSDSQGEHAYVLMTDPDGEIIWEKTIESKGELHIRSITGLADGYAISGWTTIRTRVTDPSDPSQTYGSGFNDVYLAGLDPEGKLLWERIYGGNRNDRAYAAALCRDGTIILAGQTTSYPVKGGAYIVKSVV